ncbi:hypothetical protein AMTR_s00315p00010180 [Amborella trichopoda]|uniref:Uncharacterized protein n=1 Tax=Amborella trichopoda TaxID=13333 RepID=U5CPH0_AMBTC|nr:hypothetical protein AMTR_s00315p00010180 [Amborella trichopoda]
MLSGFAHGARQNSGSGTPIPANGKLTYKAVNLMAMVMGSVSLGLATRLVYTGANIKVSVILFIIYAKCFAISAVIKGLMILAPQSIRGARVLGFLMVSVLSLFSLAFQIHLVFLVKVGNGMA